MTNITYVCENLLPLDRTLKFKYFLTDIYNETAAVFIFCFPET